MRYIGGRSSGKSFITICNLCSELELQIELNKRLGLSYKEEEKQLNELYKKLRRLKYNGNE